jgi:hypothetical protein
MKKFFKKNKIGILILIYLGLIAAFVYFLAMPSIRNIYDLADQIEKKNIDNQKSRDRISQIPRMENAYDEYQAKKDTTDVILGNDQTIEYIKKIESMAEITGNKIQIKISDIVDKSKDKKNVPAQAAATSAAQPGTPAPGPTNPNEEKGITDKLAYDKFLPVQVTLQGEYQNLVNFINKIENDRYFVDITSVQIKEVTDYSSTIDLSNNKNVFQAANQMPEGSENKPAPPTPPKPKQAISSNLDLIIYLKK